MRLLALDWTVLIQRHIRETDRWMALGCRHDDIDLWAMLCGWLASRPSHAAYRDDFPPLVRPLVWSSREAVAVRRLWHDRELLPIFWRTGWGWRLRTDWCARLGQLRTWEHDHGQTSWHELPASQPDTGADEDFPF